MERNTEQEALTALQVMRDTAENRAYRPLSSHRKAYIARIILFVKKVMRRCIKFYIEPVADQQTEFNTAAVRFMENALAEKYEMQRRIAELENALAEKYEMQRRIAELEKELRELEARKGYDLLADTRVRKLQIQGPFESSYSLAQLNRFLAESLYELGEDVSIHCTEGPGDYTPAEKDLADKPLARYLWEREFDFGIPDVAIRQMFPPMGTYLTAQYNFQYFGWEEDRVPAEYIAWFNQNLDGIGTMSDFVTDTLIRSGLTIPVKTMGVGVRLPENYESMAPYPLKTKKKTRFLHISSAFPRKGVDVLLSAFFEIFTAEDDVCLVLKTFPNVHNNVESQLAALREKYPQGPEVELINCDLEEEKLYSLYKCADCYVSCARGEGFGLPIAEAMLARIPVIVCNNSGMADFCNESTCLPVGYAIVPANSHLTENSNWAEPDKEELKKRLQDFARGYDPELIGSIVSNAERLIREKYSWKAVAARWKNFIGSTCSRMQRPSVDMVTTWNTKCGIAEFARYHVENSCKKVNYRIFPNRAESLLREDEAFVAPRIWEQNAGENDLTELIERLKTSASDMVHIQYNFSFFSPMNLSRICRELKDYKKVIAHFHGTKNMTMFVRPEEKEDVLSGLNCAYKIVVHQKEDADFLADYGVKNSIITIIPLGQIIYPVRSAWSARQQLNINSSHVIGSYGFLLPHKGIEKTIRAVALLKEKYPDICYVASCALYDAQISRDYYEACLKTINELNLQQNVLLFTDFLSPRESLDLLAACDYLVMPYDPTNESASGAVRFCVAADRPLITTDQNIFRELKECSTQIPENEPKIIADAVEFLYTYGEDKDRQKKRREYICATGWHSVIKDYLKLYRGE